MDAIMRIKYPSLVNKEGSMNHSEIFSDGVMYGIDWNTGLSWVRMRNSSPIFYSSFVTHYSEKIRLDKQFKV